MNVRYQ